MDIPTWLHALGESKIPEGLGGIGEFLTGLAVVSFGILGLRQYREGHKLDAADVLMKTEKEFRRIFRTCNAIEVGSSYSQSIRPLLDKLNKGCDNAFLNPNELKLMRELDRALRFFYICTILHKELRVDEGVVATAYYYWLGVLIRPTRTELHNYIKRDYRRLADWLKRNKGRLERYQKYGRTGWRPIDIWYGIDSILSKNSNN